MKLLVDRLKDSPEEYTFEGGQAWQRRAAEAVPELAGECAEPVRVVLRAHRMGADIYLEGTLTAALELECSRCLERYRHALSEPFRLVLEPAGKRLPPEPEAAQALSRDGICLGDELEMGWFQGHEMDLGPFFLEVVALALPVQPLCREDCRGLCPRCGVDRNRERCDCEPDRSDSRFAALRVLRPRVDRGGS